MECRPSINHIVNTMYVVGSERIAANRGAYRGINVSLSDDQIAVVTNLRT